MSEPEAFYALCNAIESGDRRAVEAAIADDGLAPLEQPGKRAAGKAARLLIARLATRDDPDLAARLLGTGALSRALGGEARAHEALRSHHPPRIVALLDQSRPGAEPRWVDQFPENTCFVAYVTASAAGVLAVIGLAVSVFDVSDGWFRTWAFVIFAVGLLLGGAILMALELALDRIQAWTRPWRALRSARRARAPEAHTSSASASMSADRSMMNR